MVSPKLGVSVVIPNFNYGHHLGECLDSLLAQSFTNWEAIIVDNFSSDQSEQIALARDDKRIRFVRFSNGGVIARSRNYGVGLANFSIIAFLDSDDFWHKDKLKTQLSFRPESWDLSYHDVSLIGKRRGAFVSWDLGPMPFEQLLTEGNPIVTSTVLLRKSLFDSVGGFPEGEEYGAVEDYFLWLTLSQRRIRFTRVPQKLASHRIHASASSDLATISALEMLSEHFLLGPSEFVTRRHMGFTSYDKGMRYRQNHEWVAAKDYFLRAVRNGSWRFRWRAIVRICESWIQLAREALKSLIRTREGRSE